MGILRSKSKKQDKNSQHNRTPSSEGHLPDVKLTKNDANHFKVRTASVHDPILSAVQEDQPFQDLAGTSEDPNMRKSYLSSMLHGGPENTQEYYNPDGTLNTDHDMNDPNSSFQLQDIFGQPIVVPDVSNPTRERDERPLDTIKSFEYAISGDPYWGQNLETQQFGFRPRPDFHLNFAQPQEIQYDQDGNPIPQANPYGNNSNYDSNGNPMMPMEEQGVYVPSAPANVDLGKKKKKGFFGRKKKQDS